MSTRPRPAPPRLPSLSPSSHAPSRARPKSSGSSRPPPRDSQVTQRVSSMRPAVSAGAQAALAKLSTSTRPSPLLARTLPRLDEDDPVITISESYIDREHDEAAVRHRRIVVP